MTAAPTALLHAGHRDVDGGTGRHEHAHIEGATLTAARDGFALHEEHRIGGGVVDLQGGHLGIGPLGDLDADGRAGGDDLAGLTDEDGKQGHAAAGDGVSDGCVLECDEHGGWELLLGVVDGFYGDDGVTVEM